MVWVIRFAVLVVVTGWISDVGAAGEDRETALLEMVKGRDQAIQDIVRSETKGETEAERAQLKAIVGELFDFERFAQRSLGRYWAERTAAEREEFVGLNRRLIEKNYGDPKLYSKAEKIDYTGVEIDGTEAVVRTEVHYKSEVSAIDYQLHLVDGKWLIFDMVIDDLSVAKSNRSQFRKEIRKSSYEGLVQKLRQKLEEDANEGKGGA